MREIYENFTRNLREIYEKSLFKMFNISQLGTLQHDKFKRSNRINE